MDLKWVLKKKGPNETNMIDDNTTDPPEAESSAELNATS